MNHVSSASPRGLVARDQHPSPDSLAKRLFVFAMLGVLACVGVIVALMLVGQ